MQQNYIISSTENIFREKHVKFFTQYNPKIMLLGYNVLSTILCIVMHVLILKVVKISYELYQYIRL